jgi:hypothetical protein
MLSHVPTLGACAQLFAIMRSNDRFIFRLLPEDFWIIVL